MLFNDFTPYIALAGVSGTIGYYMGHRGMTGVRNDLLDVKKDLLSIKDKLTNAQPTVVVMPPATPPVEAPRGIPPNV